MPIYKPTELHAFLADLGIDPNRGLSQNFLIDGNIVTKILKAADILPGDFVIEIGPGPGSLTEALLKAQAQVVAVEKDPALAQALARLAPLGDLTILCEDILKVNIPQLCHEKKAKIIGNLPYRITTPILTKFAKESASVSSLVFMVQEEVARRLSATPGQPGYGYMNLFLQFYTSLHYAFKVTKSCFYPAPKVDSAVITLEVKEPQQNIDADKFFQMLRCAFQMRRKTLRKSLQKMYPDIEKALTRANLDPKARPEQLTLEEFIALYHLSKITWRC